MKNLPVSILSSTELFTTTKRIVGVSKDALGDNPYVVKRCIFIEQGNSDLSKALGKTLTSDFTMLLYNMDAARDEAFIGFRDYAGAFTHSNKTEKKIAGRLLAAIFENIGNTIYTLGYSVVTAKIKSLIQNLSKPEAQMAIETIGAAEWLEQLTTSQEAFEATYVGKVDTKQTTISPLIKDSRAVITKYLNALLNYIATNSDFDSEKYDQIRETIDEIISEAVSIARARVTHKENVEKEKNKAST